MAYAPIAKIEKFTGKENNAQYQSLANKPQDFAVFKLAFLQYFSNNNSINQLANTFTTIKQEENKAVTTYLRCFHKNLHQIQAIQADYFTVPQILNQFIRGLHSSILQRICSMHPVDLQATVTNAQDFEAAELEASHVQAINLVMNRSSELDSKLKQFISNSKLPTQLSTISTDLPANDTTANISTICILTFSLSTTATSNISTTTATNNLSDTHIHPTSCQDHDSENYLSLLVTPEDTLPNTQKSNQKQPLINILSATVMENESLAAIFLFEIEELTKTPLFRGATLEEKPIMAIYMDAKVDDHSIKLILNSGSAGSIITKQLMDQLGR
ncbi:hypothetical protein G9A89_007046 [Geosiphon pyriformis]|nr:hypothetical protein G9A89_007046 [Geosiphon pyriformis]